MSDPDNRPEADPVPEPVADPEPAVAAAETANDDDATTAPVEDTPAETSPPVATDRPQRERRQFPPKPRVSSRPPLAAYAIVETGGKQYRMSVGDRLAVEKLEAEAGSEVTFDRVLLLGGNGTTRVGTPTVTGASVTATVEEQTRGEKIIVFKYKAKKRYRRRLGHRQSLTRLMITAISG